MIPVISIHTVLLYAKSNLLGTMTTYNISIALITLGVVLDSC